MYLPFIVFVIHIVIPMQKTQRWNIVFYFVRYTSVR